MEKPLTIRRKEMIEKICGAINDSALPAFVIRDALRSIDADLAQLQEQQYQQDVQAWTVYQIKNAKKTEQEADDGIDHSGNNNGTD